MVDNSYQSIGVNYIIFMADIVDRDRGRLNIITIEKFWIVSWLQCFQFWHYISLGVSWQVVVNLSTIYIKEGQSLLK